MIIAKATRHISRHLIINDLVLFVELIVDKVGTTQSETLLAV